MERFVQLVVAGGLAMLAGLWAVEFTAPASLARLAGAGLALAGTAVLLWGIYVELDLDGTAVR